MELFWTGHMFISCIDVKNKKKNWKTYPCGVINDPIMELQNPLRDIDL